MHEVFPVTAGILIGLAVPRLLPGRARWIALVALSVVVGVIAATISGELALSWGFVPFDTVQVLVVAGLASMASLAWKRRAWHNH